MNNPNTSASDIAKVIMSDQASSTKILKVVNSPMYGYRSNVSTISQAIVLLGHNEVNAIVISLSVMDVFKGIKKNNLFNPIDLWKFSISVGTFSKLIAEYIGIEAVEEFFLAGILHCIGKLVLLKIDSEKFIEAYQDSVDKDISTLESEKHHFGMNNCQVGEIVAENWNLPSYVRRTIRYSPWGEIKGRTCIHTTIVHFGIILSSIIESGNPLENKMIKLNRKLFNNFDFDEQLFDFLLARYPSQYNSSIEFLLSIK